jgi:hypothetical protein
MSMHAHCSLANLVDGRSCSRRRIEACNVAMRFSGGGCNRLTPVDHVESVRCGVSRWRRTGYEGRSARSLQGPGCGGSLWPERVLGGSRMRRSRIRVCMPHAGKGEKCLRHLPKPLAAWLCAVFDIRAQPKDKVPTDRRSNRSRSTDTFFVSSSTSGLSLAAMRKRTRPLPGFTLPNEPFAEPPFAANPAERGGGPRLQSTEYVYFVRSTCLVCGCFYHPLRASGASDSLDISYPVCRKGGEALGWLGGSWFWRHRSIVECQ